jgi:membrane-associated protease RseP (regulator of RpoE activity)
MLRLSAIVLLLVFVHIGAFALTASALRIAIWEVSFGFGFRLAHFHVAGFPITLRGIPLGGYLRVEEDPESDLVESPSGRPFATFHPIARAALYASGCAALFVLGGLILGWEPAARSLLRGFEQYVSGALSPLSVGRVHIDSAARLLGSGSFGLCVGVVATKFAAANLLPVPALNGWQILSTIALGRQPRPRWLEKAEPIASLLPLVFLVGWSTAVVAASVGP